MWLRHVETGMATTSTAGMLERLTRELAARDAENRALLARQAASAEVLRSIAASPDDPQPVFELIARHARVLCDAQAVVVLEYDGALLHHRAIDGHEPEAVARLRQAFPRPAGPETLAGRAVLAGRLVQVRDLSTEPGFFQQGRDLGARTSFCVPLLRDGRAIGAVLLSRFEVRDFDAADVALVESFAEQAVIAIGSATALRELRTRTAELAARNGAFGEQIEHQSATIEVLKAMSASPGDAQPVFDIITRRAMQLCNGVFGGLFELDGELLHVRTVQGFSPDKVAELLRRYPRRPTGGNFLDRAIQERRLMHP
jgi:two-component system NtrC family sensor kinase